MTDRASARSVPGERSWLRLRTQADLVEAVPYLLGFHPTESLVVVLLHGAPGQVGVTMRYDLPPPGLAGAVARDVATHASLHGADHVVLIVFSDRPRGADGPPQWPLMSQVREALRLAHLPVADLLYVCGRRWWSYLCVDPRCCPPEGQPLPSPADSPSPVAATVAQAGLAALPDRATLARTLEPPEGDARASMERALGKAEAAFIQAAASAGGVSAWRAITRDRVQSMIDRALSPEAGPGGVTSIDETAEILVALSDPSIRDHCWLGAERGGGGDRLALWAELVHRAVPPYDAAPLFLLGWTAWRRGDGVLARMAAERALASDAGYLAARLLLDAVEVGVDPRTLPYLTPHPRAGVHLEGRR